MHKLPFWVPFEVLLYDASRKLIDNRCLKKGEAIRSGESTAFDYRNLIDIGEPEGNYKSPAYLIHLNITRYHQMEISLKNHQ